MADEEKYKISLFDGSNFNNWKFRMEKLLDELDLLEIVRKPIEVVTIATTDTDPVRAGKEKKIEQLKKKNKKCKSQIEYVKDKESAHEIWKMLQCTFEPKGIASQLLIRKALLTMKLDSAVTGMASHFLKFDRTVRELRSTGATLEESDVVCHLLLTMPAEYDMVVTALETLSSEELTLSFVKNRLLDEESKREGNRTKTKNEVESSTVFTAHP